jgi:tripartite-type tricarboxylate transporter receptor subunit TctC
VDVWFGLFVPAKTTRETISRLSDWFASAVQSPEVRPKLVAQGLYPVGTCGADFATLVRKQYEDFGRVIRESNMKAE